MVVRWMANKAREKHVFIGVSVTTVRTPYITTLYTAPGCRSRDERENTKFTRDDASSMPLVRNGHRLVPFEEGGQLGERARSFLSRELARAGVAAGHLKSPPSWRSEHQARRVISWWVQRGLQLLYSYEQSSTVASYCKIASLALYRAISRIHFKDYPRRSDLMVRVTSLEIFSDFL